jgi:hypothetical protein
MIDRYIIFALSYIFINIIIIEILRDRFLKYILIFLYPAGYLTYIIYSGIHEPIVNFPTMSDLSILTFSMIYYKRYIKIIDKKLILILFILFLLFTINIAYTNNYLMYLNGIFRGLVIPLLFYSILKNSHITNEEILKYILISLFISVIISFIIQIVYYQFSFLTVFDDLRIGRIYILRAFKGRNIFAGVCLFLLPKYLALNNRKMLLCILFFLVFSFARAAWAILFVYALFSILFQNKIKYHRAYSINIIIIFIIIFTLAPYFFLPLLSSSGGSNSFLYNLLHQENFLARVEFWKTTLDYYSQSSTLNKLFGCGFATFADNVILYDLSDWHASSPHNLLMTIFYDFGIVGITIFIISVFLLYKRYWNDKITVSCLTIFLLYTTFSGGVILPEFGQCLNYFALTMSIVFATSDSVINKNNNFS